LFGHPKVIPTGCVIGDCPVMHFVPVNVLHFEALAGGLHADQRSALNSPSGNAPMCAAHPAPNDNRITVSDHFDNLHLPVGKGLENARKIIGEHLLAADDALRTCSPVSKIVLYIWCEILRGLPK